MDGLNREFASATWRKSSLSSGDGGECVEVARLNGGHVGVRDSKNVTGPALAFTATGWESFVKGVKNGTFDTL
ncbi:DUF397 domain-containing protein [Streptosporangium saharense]|uniref:DUF397 domain-containing protein n=1 Tax=Streptosporangium saharense TaxID=1706840 RepID=A0A7W7QJ00_9ACTN|nr:DUF397 domain-containing protein [Streptosporangium saharense]MBB4914480.1 hypothetical protein [Streptosporangium saharense]